MTERLTPLQLHLDLTPTPNAAAEVRAALREMVAGSSFGPRLPDAELAASELVTNAVLHGREPITVTMTFTGDHLRLEVSDAGPVSPTFSLLDPTAVTGRGMLLISALADHWGVEPLPTGKTVWVELAGTVPAPAVEADIDALLASWGDDLAVDPANECVRVVLTDLDVAQLAASEAHDEGLLRELSLVVQSEETEPRLAQTAAKVLAAAERFEGARAELKSQVALAAHRSEQLVDIELAITRGDAELVRDYREAMKVADGLTRSGELLHAPHAAELRDSYLNRVVAQLGS